ncbi:MAG: ATP-grasp domain-containing protein [Jatrophihabitans sp.]|uniref:ATP-grasp domain-containing protein n=1 Tax=Jatrophihabitans sp. TaxID=1932789 RepID=UPI003F8151C9
MDVILATCAEYPRGDEDAAELAAALERRGITARWQVWDDPAARWDDALVVVRSTWDYWRDRAGFLAWAATVPRLANRAEVLRWNTVKTYLTELAAAGIPTVPTTAIPPGEQWPTPPQDEFVLKPAVGAGSRGAGRFPADPAGLAAARQHLAALHETGRTVLMQPYLRRVDVEGERAVVVLDGQVSHAITKGALLPTGTVHPVDGQELYVQEQITAAQPDADELAVAEAAVRLVGDRFGVPLYARVDLLPSPDGPVIIELELTEPSLFLQHAPGAADRFASVLAART